MLGVAISCVLLLEIPCCIEGNRPENEYGPKSQRLFSVGPVCFFTSFIYEWFGFLLYILLFILVSIPSTWVEITWVVLRPSLQSTSLLNLFYLCATSFVFRILSTSTHQSGSWTVDGWPLRQLLLFFIISTPPWSEEMLPIIQWHPLYFV